MIAFGKCLTGKMTLPKKCGGHLITISFGLKKIKIACVSQEKYDTIVDTLTSKLKKK